MALSLLAPEELPTQALAVEAACSRVPPLWPLQNFVAVNPFLGLAEQRFAQAAQTLQRVAGIGMMSSSTVMNRPPVKTKSARLSSAFTGLELTRGAAIF